MRPFRFVHAADLHLDAPFKGISGADPSVASALKDATFRAYRNLVGLCRSEEAAFLVIAGDVYNSVDHSIQAQLKFRDGLAELAQNGIQSFVAHGNHDPRQSWLSSISWPEGVHIFAAGDVERCTVAIDNEPCVEVSGISFATQREKRNLAGKFASSGASDLFRMGVLHCNCGGQPGHDPYAPCTVQQLSEKGFHYWALGHVHERMVLSSSPHVVYPGNTQGLSIREQGPRGCYVVQVGQAGKISVDFHPLDVIRWTLLEVDIQPFETLDALDAFLTKTLLALPEQEGGLSVICRIRLTGSGELYPLLARDGAEKEMLSRMRETVSMQDPFIHVEKVENRSRPGIDINTRKQEGDLLGQLLTLVEDDIRHSSSVREVLKEPLSELFENARLRRRLQLDDFDDSELEIVLDSAERLCIDLLEGS